MSLYISALGIMFGRAIISVIILILWGAYSYYCLIIIPERVVITHVNEKYVTNVTANVRRSNKRGQYVFNLKMINKLLAGNNVSFHVTVYEHSRRYNQYVPTLIEFHYKMCDLILHDKWVGPIFRKHGLAECPFPPGPISVANMTFSGNFPYPVSFDKGKLDISWKATLTGELLGSFDVFVNFEKSQ